MVYIKYCFIIALLVVAVIISKSYCAFVDRSLVKMNSMLSFLKHIEREIGGYMTPANKLADEYVDEEISDMLIRIKEGLPLVDAYVCESGKVPSKIDEILSLYFKDFGKGDLGLELLRVREVISKIESEVSICRGDADKQKKLCRAILPSLAIGVIVLFM